MPLPTALGDTTVTLDGEALPLYFVSPQQINAQLPFDMEANAYGAMSSMLVVSSKAGTSQPLRLNISPSAPAIFTFLKDGKVRPILIDITDPEDWRLTGGVTPETKAAVLYATGLGVTDPPAVAGSGGRSTPPFNDVANKVKVWLGNRNIPINWQGLAPGMPGVHQLNLRIPDDLQPASDLLYLKAGGYTSSVMEAELPAPDELTGVSGAIQSLVPCDRPDDPICQAVGSTGDYHQVTYSPMGIVGQFTMQIEIPAAGAVYDVLAIAEGLTASVHIAKDGDWAADITVPTAQAKFGDFSSTSLPTLEFLSGCQAQSDYCGLPFPGSIIPSSRLDPSVNHAMTLLPVANVTTQGSANGSFHATGAVAPGTAFRIDSENLAEISRFGGYVNVPWPAETARTMTFSLFVNGQLIASQDVGYQVAGR